MSDNTPKAIESHLRVETDLGDGFVRLKSSEAERRQAIQDIRSSEDIVIELLRNARDAHAQHIFLATAREKNRRRIVAIDDGDGVPRSMHTYIFEPRVTSKLDTAHMDKWGVHGRGMALFSITVNAETAYIAASDTGGGTAIVVETNLDNLGEKTDQSTFPVFEYEGNGKVAVRGPRNITRTVCEFLLECHNDCTVYLGSCTDIAATLYEFGLSSLTASMKVFCSDTAELPVCQRLAVAADPASFASEAAKLGLPMSERSARRILDGEIEPLKPLIERIHIEGPQKGEGQSRHANTRLTSVSADARGLKLDANDVNKFTQDVSDAFDDLARDYYLDASVEPEVRVSKDALHITIPLIKLQ